MTALGVALIFASVGFVGGVHWARSMEEAARNARGGRR